MFYNFKKYFQIFFGSIDIEKLKFSWKRHLEHPAQIEGVAGGYPHRGEYAQWTLIVLSKCSILLQSNIFQLLVFIFGGLFKPSFKSKRYEKINAM